LKQNIEFIFGAEMSNKRMGGGRPPGSPNRVTKEARAAIADFVDGNAHRLQEWLDRVANGVPRTDAQGNQIVNDDGDLEWIVPPNPEKAFNLFQTVVEYHVPKLARSELTGANGGPIGVAAINMKGLSDAELDQMQLLLSKGCSLA
jgi:hypothetical protein